MADDGFRDVLRVLERPERPEPAFAEALYAQLAAQAGFGPGNASGWLARLRSGRPVLIGQIRLAWMIVIVALLAVLAAGFAILGSGGGQPARTTAPSAASTAGEEPSAAIVRPQSGVLEVGQPAPPWTGALLGGGAFSTDELRGRPAAIFLWCACATGPYVQTFLEAAAVRTDEVALVLVSLNEPGTTQGLVDSLGVETPVVQDTEWDLLRTWDLESYPALVLLRADGTVADIHPGTFSAVKLDAVVEALTTGEPIPDPDPFATPRSEDVSSVLRVGEPAPELRGPRLGGGELSTRDLLGRPTVVLHWVPPDAEGRPRDDTPPADTLLDEVAARSAALNLLLVAAGEETPGAVGRYLERQGSDAPVIFDWDGQLFERWGLFSWPTLVLLDADGRVAGAYRHEALIDPAPLLDALVAGDPLPSASAEWPPTDG